MLTTQPKISAVESMLISLQLQRFKPCGCNIYIKQTTLGEGGHLFQCRDGTAPAGERVQEFIRVDVPQLQRPLLAGKQHLVEVGAGMDRSGHAETRVVKLHLQVTLYGRQTDTGTSLTTRTQVHLETWLPSIT